MATIVLEVPEDLAQWMASLPEAERYRLAIAALQTLREDTASLGQSLKNDRRREDDAREDRYLERARTRREIREHLVPSVKSQSA